MRIIFITREGYNQPGARIRDYGFAKELAKKGLKTEVFSFVDNLGARAGENDKGFMRYSLKILSLLFYDLPRIFYLFFTQMKQGKPGLNSSIWRVK